MNNMEKLDGWSVSIEANGENILTISNQHLSGITNINDYKELVIHCANHLCAFIGAEDAKALQSSEPVAEVRCRNGEVFGYIPSRVLRDMLPLGTKLFTHSPATVRLEQYKNLLDLLQELDRALCVIGVVGKIDGYDVIRRNSVIDNTRDRLKKAEANLQN